MLIEQREILSVETFKTFPQNGSSPPGPREQVILEDELNAKQRKLADDLLETKIQGLMVRRIWFDGQFRLVHLQIDVPIINIARDDFEFAGPQHEPRFEGDEKYIGLPLSPIQINFDGIPQEISEQIETYGDFTLPQLVKYYRRKEKITPEQYDRVTVYLAKNGNSNYVFQTNP